MLDSYFFDKMSHRVTGTCSCSDTSKINGVCRYKLMNRIDASHLKPQVS